MMPEMQPNVPAPNDPLQLLYASLLLSSESVNAMDFRTSAWFSFHLDMYDPLESIRVYPSALQSPANEPSRLILFLLTRSRYFAHCGWGRLRGRWWRDWSFFCTRVLLIRLAL
jgi:hypothetical protein